MGYTHYWRFKKLPKNIDNSETKFAMAVNLFRVGLEKLGGKCRTTRYIWDKDFKNYETVEETVPMKLCGGNGFGEPKIDNTHIIFNGDGSKDLDHETFYVTMDYNEEDAKFSFCKTARKPYDTAVCLALLCLKEYFGDDITVSSDGNMESEAGWKEAHEIFDQIRLAE